MGARGDGVPSKGPAEIRTRNIRFKGEYDYPYTTEPVLVRGFEPPISPLGGARHIHLATRVLVLSSMKRGSIYHTGMKGFGEVISFLYTLSVSHP